MTDRHISLDAAIEALGNIPVNHKGCPRDLALDDAIEALSALPAVGGWLDIEEAKSGEYVLAKVSHDAAHYGGRWFVVRYMGEGDWSLHPGYGVGDDYFSAYMPLPAPPEIE